MRRALAIFAGLGLLAAGDAVRAEELNQTHFTGLMNSVFGAGAWRQTGGYRTPEREDQLRREGAMTTPPGVLSRHSVGHPDAPGAYDLVVDGLSPGEAAARLRASGVPFRRLLPEGAHGTQGPHLHLEPLTPGSAPAGRRPEARAWTVTAPTPAEEAVTRLHQAAVGGDVAAQLALAEAYQRGWGAPMDLVAAYFWAVTASESDRADAAARRLAAQRLSALSAKMAPADLRTAQQLSLARNRAGCPAAAEAGPVLRLVPAALTSEAGGGAPPCAE